MTNNHLLWKKCNFIACFFAITLQASCMSDSSEKDNQSARQGTNGQSWTTLGNRELPSVVSTSSPKASSQKWQDYNPTPSFLKSITQDNISLTMDDGVKISLSVGQPLDNNGKPLNEPTPTIVTFTPYNKNAGGDLLPGTGINPTFLFQGYNHVVIDVRGTGRSGGGWDPFSAREQADYSQVLDWIVSQPWSNGTIGLYGISATATAGLLAASSGHPSVKAVFSIVPHGDIYRDVVFVGGQASIAFLPAWMSAVTALSIVNPTFYEQPEQFATAVLQHILGLNDFLIPRTAGVLLEQSETAYDNEYWKTKAPLEFATRNKAPTFIVGGLFDIFQRSEPLNYEALKQHTTAKLLIGPWHHLQAAAGEGLPTQNIPALDHIALMWFDRYLKLEPNGAESLPNVTQWVWGQESYTTSSDWPHPSAKALRLFLHDNGSLMRSKAPAASTPTTVLQQPINGICSQSSLQISLGLVGYAPLPCWYEDNLAQALEATFDSPILDEDIYINGPIQADIWVSTTALNAGLVVRLSDLQPNGIARALTSGIQTASLRAVDERKSRYLNGEMIQPWHPFTRETVQPLKQNEVVKVSVEIFPTSALVKKGHQLRISVGASNFPFAAMPLPSLAQSALGVLSIHTTDIETSSIVLPIVPVSEL